MKSCHTFTSSWGFQANCVRFWNYRFTSLNTSVFLSHWQFVIYKLRQLPWTHHCTINMQVWRCTNIHSVLLFYITNGTECKMCHLHSTYRIRYPLAEYCTNYKRTNVSISIDTGHYCVRLWLLQFLSQTSSSKCIGRVYCLV